MRSDEIDTDITSMLMFLFVYIVNKFSMKFIEEGVYS